MWGQGQRTTNPEPFAFLSLGEEPVRHHEPRRAFFVRSGFQADQSNLRNYTKCWGAVKAAGGVPSWVVKRFGADLLTRYPPRRHISTPTQLPLLLLRQMIVDYKHR